MRHVYASQEVKDKGHKRTREPMTAKLFSACETYLRGYAGCQVVGSLAASLHGNAHCLHHAIVRQEQEHLEGRGRGGGRGGEGIGGWGEGEGKRGDVLQEQHD